MTQSHVCGRPKGQDEGSVGSVPTAHIRLWRPHVCVCVCVRKDEGLGLCGGALPLASQLQKFLLLLAVGTMGFPLLFTQGNDQPCFTSVSPFISRDDCGIGWFGSENSLTPKLQIGKKKRTRRLQLHLKCHHCMDSEGVCSLYGEAPLFPHQPRCFQQLFPLEQALRMAVGKTDDLMGKVKLYESSHGPT